MWPLCLGLSVRDPDRGGGARCRGRGQATPEGQRPVLETQPMSLAPAGINLSFSSWSTRALLRFKRKGVLIHAAAWVNLEKSQAQKAPCCMIPFLRSVQDTHIEAESRWVVARGWGRGKCGVTA